MGSFIDHTGSRHGRLVVLSYKGRDSHKKSLWECKCDCGNITTIRSTYLDSGDTPSCGCFQKEASSARMRDRVSKDLHFKKPAGEAAFNQLYGAYRAGAERRGLDFDITEDTFRELTQSNCFYCDLPPSQKVPVSPSTNGNYIHTGIDRIDSSIGYIDGNVRPCCKQCNHAKWIYGEKDFYIWVLRVLDHQISMKQGE